MAPESDCVMDAENAFEILATENPVTSIVTIILL